MGRKAGCPTAQVLRVITATGLVDFVVAILSIIIFAALPLSQRPSGAATFAKVITEQYECVRGIGASSRVGDILMGNEHLRIAISSIGHAHRGAASGGNIIDATLVGRGDSIEQVLLFIERYPRQARYTSVEILKDGSEGIAIVEARGVDSFTGELKLTTQYILRAGEKFLTMRTTIVNAGAKLLKGMMLGDAIQCGHTRIYAPMHGYGAANKTFATEWIAYKGIGIAYGVCAPSGAMNAINGISWSDVIYARADIEPNTSFTYERHFIIAEDIADVAGIACSIHGHSVATVIGSVKQRVGERPVAWASISVLDQSGKPFAEATTKSDGSFFLQLPEGDYTLKPIHIARRAVGKLRLSLRKGEVKRVTLLMSAPSFLRFAVYELPYRRIIPARLKFIGIGDTETPNFGSPDKADGAINMVASMGSGLRPIAPGRYRIIASRGFEYMIDEEVLTMPEGRTVFAQFFLRRAINTEGWLSVDPHQHCSNSFDSSVNLKDRIISNLAEGVECFVMTDHDFVTDPMPLIQRMGVRKLLLGIAGQEVTTRHLGHFNIFPIPFDAGKTNCSAIDWTEKNIREIFSQARSFPGVQVIQVNHPRIGRSYFNVVKLDPKTGKSEHEEWSADFDCIEVLNAKMMHTVDEALKDWFALLNIGHRFTATGGSDSHHIAIQEVGCPRCFVFVGNDEPSMIGTDDVVKAFRAGQVIISMGPFVTMTIDGYGIGRMIKPRYKTALLRIKVQAAPWIDVKEVRVISNGCLIKRFKIPHSEMALRFDKTMRISPKRDAWYIVMVRGDKPLSPIVSDYAGYEGITYPVKPFAVTNPIWVDADGDGYFTPPSR